MNSQPALEIEDHLAAVLWEGVVKGVGDPLHEGVFWELEDEVEFIVFSICLEVCCRFVGEFIADLGLYMLLQLFGMFSIDMDNNVLRAAQLRKYLFGLKQLEMLVGFVANIKFEGICDTFVNGL
jgi:hypothetical protein